MRSRSCRCRSSAFGRCGSSACRASQSRIRTRRRRPIATQAEAPPTNRDAGGGAADQSRRRRRRRRPIAAQAEAPPNNHGAGRGASHGCLRRRSAPNTANVFVGRRRHTALAGVRRGTPPDWRRGRAWGVEGVQKGRGGGAAGGAEGAHFVDLLVGGEDGEHVPLDPGHQDGERVEEREHHKVNEAQLRLAHLGGHAVAHGGHVQAHVLQHTNQSKAKQSKANPPSHQHHLHVRA
eukprot:1186562-Prorocentrum_minimum.AAC.1